MSIQLKKQVIEILEVLQKARSDIIASELTKELKIDYIVLMSAINDLKDNGLADFREEEVDSISLNEEGVKYLWKGLPERQIIEFLLKNNFKEIDIEDLSSRMDLDKKLFYIGISNMKKNKWITTSKSKEENTLYLLSDKYPKTELEELLAKFNKENPVINASDLTNEDITHLDILNKRKLIERKKKTQRIIYLTAKGKKIKSKDIKELQQISKITAEMLSTGSWKDYNLKSFDVTKSGPTLKAGKIHPVINLINEIREIFISMGFTEIRGPIVESAFFNFDALFQPQDHPAREMHDTFYLNNPKVAKLPEKGRVAAVKATHENGGNSGSQGWGYKWDENVAKKTLLRTHTTATTIRRLAQYYREKDVAPIKVFSIDRVFRNEKVDKTHLAEFTQIEGIVIGDNVTLSNLIAILKEFYRKMGFEKIVTRPGFFPYTEPSMEIAVFYDKLGRWVEMGGSGVFRPEVTYPWGIENPTRVLAWGMGMERLAMLKFGRTDIRDLYINPVNWLRNESY